MLSCRNGLLDLLINAVSQDKQLVILRREILAKTRWGFSKLELNNLSGRSYVTKY